MPVRGKPERAAAESHPKGELSQTGGSRGGRDNGFMGHWRFWMFAVGTVAGSASAALLLHASMGVPGPGLPDLPFGLGSGAPTAVIAPAFPPAAQARRHHEPLPRHSPSLLPGAPATAGAGPGTTHAVAAGPPAETVVPRPRPRPHRPARPAPVTPVTPVKPRHAPTGSQPDAPSRSSSRRRRRPRRGRLRRHRRSHLRAPEALRLRLRRRSPRLPHGVWWRSARSRFRGRSPSRARPSPAVRGPIYA